MGRRTLAVDIDGTLTVGRTSAVHLGAVGELRRLAAAGHNVIPVTGRSSVEGHLLAVFGGFGAAAVGENGSCITLGPSEHILLGDMGACRDALAALGQEIAGVAEKPVFPRMAEVVLERTFDVERGREVLARSGLPVSLSDSGYAYHLNSGGVDKGSGLGELLSRMGVSSREVIAIGDSETDVPLFGAAETSVALGNAPPHVRAAASIAVAAAAGEGVLEALGKLAPELS